MEDGGRPHNGGRGRHRHNKGGRGSQHRQQLHHQHNNNNRRHAAANDDDRGGGGGAEDEDQSWVTRCPCGRNDDDGDGEFMIQCDKCAVWQHGLCVGIAKDSVPEKYECDLCNPVKFQERMAVFKQMKASLRGTKRKKLRPGAAVPIAGGAVSSSSLGSNASSGNGHGSLAATGNLGSAVPRRNSDVDLGDPASKRQKVGHSASSDSKHNSVVQSASSTLSPQQTQLLQHAAASGSLPELHDVVMEDSKLSREDRKLQQYMAMINKLEGGTTSGPDKKRKVSGQNGGSGTPPDHVVSGSPGNKPKSSSTVAAPNNHSGGTTTTNSRRRRNSRASSFSNEDLLDLDVLKSSPEMLKQLFPMSPMYLGRKTWIVHMLSKVSGGSAPASINMISNGSTSAKQVVLPKHQATGDPGSWSVKKRLLAGNFA
eukprot:TRINITY_DN1107_c0_g1_i1.p1 TRINITY_DN1107_c0_g1~~TRINITY_DN1107_c0_g1_i1.p1  ORF type:complete len:444 (-),score=73.72 TRINITY_DN1107_c0_g1_i1:793-2070(-)